MRTVVMHLDRVRPAQTVVEGLGNDHVVRVGFVGAIPQPVREPMFALDLEDRWAVGPVDEHALVGRNVACFCQLTKRNGCKSQHRAFVTGRHPAQRQAAVSAFRQAWSGRGAFR